jgi:hypothetical protein
LHRTIFFFLFKTGISPEWHHRPIDHVRVGYMSTIQIVGFGLAVFWAASFVFSGYLLLPRRTELD